jgi:hypothetical protein
VKDVRLTHVGGRTVLIEAAGWRLAGGCSPIRRLTLRANAIPSARARERFKEDREDIERAHLLVRAAHNGPINAVT